MNIISLCNDIVCLNEGTPEFSGRIDGEWGVTNGNQAIDTLIGWGCPIVPFISNIRDSQMMEVLAHVNYFVPIGALAFMFTTFVIAVGLYYAASIVLRWVKAIS